METLTEELKAKAQEVNVTLISFTDACAQGVESGVVPYRPPKPEEIASLIYTSGTTGNPKGVIHTHSTIIAAMTGLLEAGIDFTSQDRYLSYLPTAHICNFYLDSFSRCPYCTRYHDQPGCWYLLLARRCHQAF